MTHAHDPGRNGLSRREFLRRAGLAGVALPSMATFLEACSKSNVQGAGGSPGAASANPYGTGGLGGAAFPLARPDKPVTWAIPADNQPIADGLSSEAGPLRIFGYNDYVYKKVRNAFSDKYGAKIQYTVFTTPEGMVRKMQTPNDFDVIVSITPDNLGKLVAGKLIQPLNHSYITNFGSVWQSLQSPFYDVGSKYSVPYTVYTTGIAWRNDLIADDIPNLPNPYEVLWNSKYKGKAHLLNGSRDALSAALLKNGWDVNTQDPAVLDKAKADLLAGAAAMNWKYDHVDYTELPVGTAWVHQAWSGQEPYEQYYLPKGGDIKTISYFWPPSGGAKMPGLIQNDAFAVGKGAKNPVLAHLFIDFLLEAKNAMTNYGYEGYQPPIAQFDAQKVVADGLVPPNLANVLIKESDFTIGVRELEIAPAANQLWESIYQQVTGGA